MNKVRDGIWISDVYSVAMELKNHPEITAVMSCIQPDERTFLAPHDKKKCFIEINDGEAYPFSWLTKALEQLDLWLQDGENVVVHCAAGISRSSSTIIAHLIGHGATWDEAEEEVRRARPIIMPHPELKRSILKYYKIYPYDGSLGEPV